MAHDVFAEITRFQDAVARLPRPLRWLVRRSTGRVDPVRLAEVLTTAARTGTPVTVRTLEEVGVPSFAGAITLRSAHTLLTRVGSPEAALFERPGWRAAVPRPRQVLRLVLVTMLTNLLLAVALVAGLLAFYWWSTN